MAKSARRRNAKKTIGRKKRLTKGYRRKTMRKRKRVGGGGEQKDPPKLWEPGRSASAPILGDTDVYSGNESDNSFDHSFINDTRPQSSQLLQSAKYNVEDAGENWFVTIRTEGKKETYSVPKNILRKVNRFTDVTPLG